MSELELEEENIIEDEKPLKNKSENKEDTIENDIDAEIGKIIDNSKNIQHEIDSLGGEKGLKEALEKKDKEGVSNIYQTTRKIVMAIGALIAIPAVASMINPEMVNNISNFMNSGAGETVALSALGVLTISTVTAMFLDKDYGIKLKDIFGPNKSILEEIGEKDISSHKKDRSK